MAGFLFRLETADGAPAKPPTHRARFRTGATRDPIHLGRRVLRALGKREDDADQPPVLIVEDVA